MKQRQKSWKTQDLPEPSVRQRNPAILWEADLSPGTVPVSYTHLDVYKRQLLDHGGVLDKKEAADRYKVTAPVIRKFEEDGILVQESRIQYRNPFEGHFEQKEGTCLLYTSRCV